mmetsp:Transcript_23518/g.44724  ORF Transcript_23518/g.44724 Transcript_23518/m.44724 type:complete len:109 (-) Transcript_23518:1754-2080(-)
MLPHRKSVFARSGFYEASLHPFDRCTTDVPVEHLTTARGKATVMQKQASKLQPREVSTNLLLKGRRTNNRFEENPNKDGLGSTRTREWKTETQCVDWVCSSVHCSGLH